MKAFIFLIFLSLPAIASQPVRGTIFFGPEAMYFVPCGSVEKQWLGNGTWNAKGWDEVDSALSAQPRCDLDTMPCTPQKVFIRGVAELSAPGSFGHMREYPREVTFAELHLVKAEEGSRCDS